MPQALKIYQIKTSQGLELSVLNYGARVHSLKIPLTNKTQNIVLTYPKLEDYLSDEFYIGATIGRFCNRIHGGKVSINNKTFALGINETDKNNTLHGGFTGFDKYFWDLVSISEDSIELKIVSQHLDQGFPGNLEVRARYSVKELSLNVEYFALSDQNTLVNLCNHTYFNLNGFNDKNPSSIKEHSLLLHTKTWLPLDESQVPTGEILNISDSTFKIFNSKSHSKDTKICKILESKPLERTKGLDHSFLMNADNSFDSKLHKVAELYSQEANLALDVHTNQLAVHVYSGNHLHSGFIKHAGICFETQAYPDSPNHENFPSALLKANTNYHAKTIYTLKPNFLASNKHKL